MTSCRAIYSLHERSRFGECRAGHVANAHERRIPSILDRGEALPSAASCRFLRPGILGADDLAPGVTQPLSYAGTLREATG